MWSNKIRVESVEIRGESPIPSCRFSLASLGVKLHFFFYFCNVDHSDMTWWGTSRNCLASHYNFIGSLSELIWNTVSAKLGASLATSAKGRLWQPGSSCRNQ